MKRQGTGLEKYDGFTGNKPEKRKPGRPLSGRTKKDSDVRVVITSETRRALEIAAARLGYPSLSSLVDHAIQLYLLDLLKHLEKLE